MYLCSTAFSLLFVGLKAAALMHQSVEEGTEGRPNVEDGPLTDQQLGLRQAEERLYRDYIHRLLKVRKRSSHYPNYQYLCKLCSVHIENIQGAHKHIKEKRHKKNIMEKQEENELRALPPPSAAQLRAVDAAVRETARQQGISEEDFEVRKAVVVRMEEIIKRHLSGCDVIQPGLYFLQRVVTSLSQVSKILHINNSQYLLWFFQLVLSVSMVHVSPDLPSRQVISTSMSPTLPQ
uniref:Terminal uridylyltransferase 4/7 nucleotidyltransferase domain-containing protein n=1 Tax=Seriola dumerili TaxID=41447 RepID=A0A3B4VHM6_SERDU